MGDVMRQEQAREILVERVWDSGKKEFFWRLTDGSLKVEYSHSGDFLSYLLGYISNGPMVVKNIYHERGE